jgi:hypothetical protein
VSQDPRTPATLRPFRRSQGRSSAQAPGGHSSNRLSMASHVRCTGTMGGRRTDRPPINQHSTRTPRKSGTDRPGANPTPSTLGSLDSRLPVR